jgi:teichuronic acid biosynthesis glycosyltransferase TuaH
MAEVSARSGRDVVFTFSGETLADAQQREFCRPPDRALLALCGAKDKIHRILVANPWRCAPVVALKTLRSRRSEGSSLSDITLLRPMRLNRREPTGLTALQRSYQRYDSILERHVHELRLDRPVVLTFNPFVAAYCGLGWASTITYYARDDWASFPPVAPWWPAYRHAYRSIRDRGAHIICVSSELAARVAPDAPAVVLPNGIDEGNWSQYVPPPTAVLSLQHPIVTYAGTIDARLDVGLIAKVADEDSVGAIALIGPIGNGIVAERLKAIPKVRLCGVMSQRDLAGALMHTDACLIPHVDNSLTRAMSPLKLYEYLAAGKPVAATKLPPVTGISGRVIEADGDGFPDAVRAALKMPDQEEAERLEFVHSNSWAIRHDRMLKVILAGDTDWWKQ